MPMARFRIQTAALFAIISASFAHSTTAQASEGGASFYLLGSGAPDAAVLPPVPGVFLDNSIYVYGGKSGAERDLVIGGNVVADVDATIVADFATLLWVPSTDVAGGTLALGAAFAVGAPQVDASAVITGPSGRVLEVSRHDSALLVGDPIISASLGWKTGKLHVATSALINIPVGTYREGALANLSFHRWVGDVSLAASWHDDEAGFDLSGKVGVTFNGANDYTDYNTGNELHLEASVDKNFGEKLSAGLFEAAEHDLDAVAAFVAALAAFDGLVPYFPAREIGRVDHDRLAVRA